MPLISFFLQYDYDGYGGGGHTGDPMLDREHDRQFQSEFVPDAIKRFLTYFRDMINEGNTFEVANLYENSWPKLTEEYFKTTPWPDAEEIAPFVHDDSLFLILYKELYYRHIYARISGGPKIEQRFEFIFHIWNILILKTFKIAPILLLKKVERNY